MKPIIDISYYQHPDLIDYDLLCKNISGVIIRAAYGSEAPGRWKGPDIYWERHYYEFTKRDMPRGTYQYITEYQPVEDQVEVLRKAIEGKKLAIGRWADVELENGAEALTKQTVHSYMQQAEAAMGEFGIYTRANVWMQIMGGAYYTNRKLWIAAYTGTATLDKRYVAVGWPSYWLWQNHGTETGRIPGYAKGIDRSEFCCGEETFNNWVNGVTLPPPEPEQKLELYAPTHVTWITQAFGVNPQWYSAARGHNGLDYGTIVGTPIFAALDGKVEVSQEQTTGYGRHIRIRHEHGLTIYGHLSKRFVQVGDVVKAKQLIGLSGGALTDKYCGMSTGPHLHFEYRQDAPVVPLVPGSYTYNAINTLPFTLDWEEELGQMLFQVKTLVNLNVRTGIGTGYSVIRATKIGEILNVYEVTNGWYRVGSNQWVSGSDEYTQKITPVGELTLEQKVDKLWEKVFPEG